MLRGGLLTDLQYFLVVSDCVHHVHVCASSRGENQRASLVSAPRWSTYWCTILCASCACVSRGENQRASHVSANGLPSDLHYFLVVTDCVHMCASSRGENQRAKML